MMKNALVVKRNATTTEMKMLPGGVLAVQIAGPLTGDALLLIKFEVMSHYARQVRAFFVDYTRALIALEGADLDAVLAGESGGSTPSMPAAMVVSPACVDLFRAHSARMALRGHFRRVFTRPEPALQWAQQMATRPTP